MALTVTLHPNYLATDGEIADKVRDLPANQGKNDNAMWLLIDAEIAAAIAASKLAGAPRYDTVVNGVNNKHGRA